MKMDRDNVKELADFVAKELENVFLQIVKESVGHELSDAEEAEALYTLAAADAYSDKRARAILGFGSEKLNQRQEIALVKEKTRLFSEFTDEIGTPMGYQFWHDFLS